MGLSEASPLVRWFATLGPELGVLLSKVAAVTIALFCAWQQRLGPIRVVNYWCAAMVVWNLALLSLAVLAA
jgi:hypothetical protein